MSVVDNYTLENFIAEIEAAHFRTVSDTGANPNALFIWNQVREFAGMVPLTRQELRDKEPDVAKMHDIRNEYRFQHAMAGDLNFPHFNQWFADYCKENEL